MGLLRSARTPGEAVDAAMDRVTAAMVPAATDPSTLPISSPFSPSTTLERVVYEDVFGTEHPVNTRTAAMRIPTVARARNLIVSTIARFPLRAYRGPTILEPGPSWMHRTNQATSPQLRLAWTVDDLMFYGWSCWSRVNAADRFPLYMDRIPFEDWAVNEDNRVEVNGQVVPDDSVTLIPGLHEGILAYGVDALRDTRTLMRNVRQRLKNPTPQLELHQTGGTPLVRTEIDELVGDWAAAREGENGGVAYTNQSIELREHGTGGEQLMIEARNAAAVELARIVGVHASLVDATAPKASLNYETTTGRNQEFVDLDLALYMTPVTARLSLDDVMPEGQRAVLDMSDFTSPTVTTTGPPLED